MNHTTLSIKPNINAAPCGNRTDFLKLWNDNPACFANQGILNINVYTVYRITTGNNYVSFIADGINYPGNGNSYCPNTNLPLSYPYYWMDVTQVSITGPRRCQSTL